MSPSLQVEHVPAWAFGRGSSPDGRAGIVVKIPFRLLVGTPGVFLEPIEALAVAMELVSRAREILAEGSRGIIGTNGIDVLPGGGDPTA